MRAQILPEAERFRHQPRLLQFNQHQLFLSGYILNACREINAEQRDAGLAQISVLVTPHFQVTHFLLQQGGKQHLGRTFVLHQEFEHGVINRIGDKGLHFIFLLVFAKVQIYFRTQATFRNSFFAKAAGDIHLSPAAA